MKKIGIIGSGAVGKTLAKGCAKHGYEVKIGSRDPNKLNEWKTTTDINIHTGTFAEAAAFGDMVILCVKGHAAKEALHLAEAENLAGKTIIDTTNPIDESAPPVNGVLKMFTTDHSLMELLQSEFQEANFVKAFNSVGNGVMVNPDYGSDKPTMFICGNDLNAKDEVTELLDVFGYEAADMGVVEAARAIEPLCVLWCILGFNNNEWSHAFRLLHKK